MESDTDTVVSIKTYTKDVIKLSGKWSYIAEDLCIYAAESCQIGPIARNLFGLWCPEIKAWLCSSHEIVANGTKKWFFEFKLRFKLPSISHLEELKDFATIDYYFHQIRGDFLTGKIPELSQHKSKALGLAATDMIREMLEKHHDIDSIRGRYKDFLPQELWKSHRFWLKQPLLNSVSEGLVNSKNNVAYVKEQFMYQIYDLAPDYGCEQYKALMDEDGKVMEISLQINPYHQEQPGLRLQMKSSKSKWIHICSIEDLYYISMRKDNTVEISRRNGIPQYVKFNNLDQLRSFVSCLDGYYRFTEKWTFNLCKELPTPSLQKLKLLKSHGPVGYKFSYQKLKEKKNFDPGTYLMRESSSSYNELRMDICLPAQEKPVTLQIFILEEMKFRLSEEETIFDTIQQLVAHTVKKIKLSYPVYCVTPSEYDKTRLLLCRPENRENQGLSNQWDCSQCIPVKALVIDSETQIKGKFFNVFQGKLRQSGGDMKPVTIKALLPNFAKTHVQEFLKQSSKIMEWKCQAIVSTVGIVLHSPLALVLEYLPLGPLDIYLHQHSNILEQVDLLETATYLATALWYLEEQKCCHGKIRCRNLMVALHTEKSLKVKLCDPGILVYDVEDYPWIPPECHSDYSSCQYSVQADVFAFGTTMWEIFSYGEKPSIQDYGNNEVFNDLAHLPKPTNCHDDLYKLMLECWIHDPDNRKQPQAIMRDVNQTLYEVYNSRRSHSYATVNPTPIVSKNDEPRSESRMTTPRLNRHQIQGESPSNTWNQSKKPIRSAIQNVKIGNQVPYDEMSAYSGSSEHSTFTMFSDVESIDDVNSVPVGSLISLGESMNDINRDNNTTLSETDQSSPWVIDFNDLTMGQTLGQGFYGEVCKATYSQWEGLKKEVVAVKSMKKSQLSFMSESGLIDLHREINIMKSLRHKNIVEIKGLVEDPQTMLVMEYLELGSLLAYLQMYKKKLTTTTLLKFASDIAEGMHYLEQKHIVHRDLASRNILVASPNSVKISDFGLAQFTEDHYYRVRTERNLPIRWYSPESIKYGKFSHKSDVWSFGVTLWEIFSFGENPMIPDVPDTCLSAALEKGHRLSQPEQCPSDVYYLMCSCWQMNSHARPSFSEIFKQTEDMKEKLE